MNFIFILLHACFMFRLDCLTLSPSVSFPFVGIIAETDMFADGNTNMSSFSVSVQVLIGTGPDLLSFTPVWRITSLISGFCCVSYKREVISFVHNPLIQVLDQCVSLCADLLGLTPLITESPMMICVVSRFIDSCLWRCS